jgi:hypothetical protein
MIQPQSTESTVCREFSRTSNCKYGSSCKFLHDETASLVGENYKSSNQINSSASSLPDSFDVNNLAALARNCIRHASCNELQLEGYQLYPPTLGLMLKLYTGLKRVKKILHTEQEASVQIFFFWWQHYCTPSQGDYLLSLGICICKHMVVLFII